MRISLFLREEYFPITQSLSFNISIPHPSCDPILSLTCPPPSSHFSLPHHALALFYHLVATSETGSLSIFITPKKPIRAQRCFFQAPQNCDSRHNPTSLFQDSKTKIINYQAGSDRYGQRQGLFLRDRTSPPAFDFQPFPHVIIPVRRITQMALSRVYHS